MRINTQLEANARALCEYQSALGEGKTHEEALLVVWLNGDANGRVSPPSPKPRRKRKVAAISLGGEAWRALRYRVLQSANGRCQCCGATPESSGHPLHVDHIKPKSKYPELAMEFSNLQVLCKDCNFGKNKWDQTDWRKILPAGVE